MTDAMDDLVDRLRVYADGLTGKNELSVGPHMSCCAMGEAADRIEALQARVLEHDRIVAEKDAEIARLREALGAELAATRDKALDDAARMVDCACECRDAVLAAKTKVERWNACGRDPCGALDAADIRALKVENIPG